MSKWRIKEDENGFLIQRKFFLHWVSVDSWGSINGEFKEKYYGDLDAARIKVETFKKYPIYHY